MKIILWVAIVGFGIWQIIERWPSHSVVEPSITSITVDEYKSKCRGSESYFDKICKGKFVIFEGRAQNWEYSDTVRVKVDNLGFDVNFDEQEIKKINRANITDALIRFSGYMREQHFINDDVSHGKILAIVKTSVEMQEKKKQEEAQEAEARRAKERSDPENTKYARLWNVGIDDYLKAKELLSDAGTKCHGEAKKRANWQVESISWIRSPYDDWSMSNSHIIQMRGSNLRMQNGFGAWKNVKYDCTYNIDLQEIATIMIQ